MAEASYLSFALVENTFDKIQGMNVIVRSITSIHSWPEIRECVRVARPDFVFCVPVLEIVVLAQMLSHSNGAPGRLPPCSSWWKPWSLETT